MKLKQIELDIFRNFSRFDTMLDERLTALVARNSQGKPVCSTGLLFSARCDQ